MGIPIRITGAFWLFAAIIGFLNSGNVVGTLIWVGVIFISVLFHEFGHALTAIVFGLKPRIELVALGGVTYHEGGSLPFWKQFLIVLNGPLFGFLLFLMASIAVQIPLIAESKALSFVQLLRLVNLFWTVLNLVPVMPLDGGQLLRIACEGFWGSKGFRASLIISMVIGTSLSLVFFLFQSFLVGALFFLLAFQSYDAFRQTRHLSDPDRSEALKLALESAEAALEGGKKEEAASAFEHIRQQAKEGMLYNMATQYLAYLKYERGEPKLTYDLLKPLREDLGNDALCLLHRAAFDEKDYALVMQIGGDCFQYAPTFETALRNAYACAALSQAEAAIGWLETAREEGVENLTEILKSDIFDPIRSTRAFQDFIHSL